VSVCRCGTPGIIGNVGAVRSSAPHPGLLVHTQSTSASTDFTVAG
jgi:hypothetical protein